MIGRPPLRTPDANRAWRAFVRACWHRQAIRRGRCPGCGHKKHGQDLQHERCGDCRARHARRAKARYDERKAA